MSPRLDNAISLSSRLLLLMSFLRIGAPFAGLIMGGVPGLIIGLAIAIFCHSTLYPYAGYRLFSVKTINDRSEFIELPKWLVPSHNTEISGKDYEYLSEKVTGTSREYLKEILNNNGKVTYWNVANLCLLEDQLGKRVESEEDQKCKRDELMKELND